MVGTAYLLWSPSAKHNNVRSPHSPILSPLQAFQILGQPQFAPLVDRFSAMEVNEWPKVRRTIVDIILATDLKEHNAFLTRFEKRSAEGDFNYQERPEDRLLVQQIMVKCGDIGHPAKARALHLQWSELVIEEFCQQGEKEKHLAIAHEMTVTYNTRRDRAMICRSQMGFINYLVLPLYNIYCSVMDDNTCKERVVANLTYCKVKE